MNATVTPQKVALPAAKAGILHRVATALPGWAWLTLIAGFLRFVNIGQEALWYDESFTAWLSKLDWTNLWQAIRGDVHPPLWYVIEWVNVRLFGTSEIALRVPSAILGVLCVLVVWRLAIQVGFRPRTAFAAGLLAAILPAAIYYSQDARMYPLLACCVLAAALFAMRGNWILFGLASVGAVYAQNLGVLYVLAIGIVLLLTRARSARRAAHSVRHIIAPVLALAGVVTVWAPWALWGITNQISQMSKGFWIQPVTLGGLLTPLVSMTTGWRIAEQFQIHVAVVAVSLSLVGLIASRHWIFKREGLFVLAVVIGTPVLIALASFVWRSIYLPRAMLPSTLALMLIWAYPLEHLGKQNKVVARAVVVPILALALISHYFPATGARFAIEDWTQKITDNWQRGDVVYHIAIDSTIMFRYYLPSQPYYLMPEATDLNQSLTPQTKAAMGFSEATFDQLALMGYRRAWLVVSDNLMTSTKEENTVRNILASHAYSVMKEDDQLYNKKVIYLVTLS